MSILSRTSKSDSNVDIKQSTGQSTTSVMSQKATTDMIFDPITDASVFGVKVKIDSTTPLDTDEYSNDTIRIGSNGNDAATKQTVLIGARMLPDVGLGQNNHRVTAVGFNSRARSMGTALGYQAYAGDIDTSDGSAATAVGYMAVSKKNGVAIGNQADSSGAHSVAIGNNSVASADSVVSVGSGTSNANYGKRRVINVADPVNAQDAATKAYVDSSISGSIKTIFRGVVSIEAIGWQFNSTDNYYYYNIVSGLNNVLANDNVFTDIELSDTIPTAKQQATEYSKIFKQKVANAQITLICFDNAPNIDLNINILVLR